MTKLWHIGEKAIAYADWNCKLIIQKIIHFCPVGFPRHWRTNKQTDIQTTKLLLSGDILIYEATQLLFFYVHKLAFLFLYCIDENIYYDGTIGLES